MYGRPLRRSCWIIPFVLLAVLAPAAHAGPLEIVSSVRVEAPKGLYRLQPLRFSFVARNASPAPVRVAIFDVPVRGPAGDALDVECAGGRGVTLAPGQQFACSATAPGGYGSNGTYSFWADWLDTNGAWHFGELGPPATFTLAHAPLTTLNAGGLRNLGAVTIGTASAVTPVTIANTGSAPLLIDPPALRGAQAGDFAIAGDSCSPAPVAAGATCVFGVRFAPTAVGPRAATIVFRANTPAAGGTVEVTGSGAAPPPPPPPPPPAGPAPLERLSASLVWNHRRGKRRTRVTKLEVRDVPAGAQVAVRCARGCSRKALRTSTTRKGVVSLRAFIRRPLGPRTKIVVTVTRAGAVGTVKTLTMHAGRNPSLTTRCLPPGAPSPTRC